MPEIKEDMTAQVRGSCGGTRFSIPEPSEWKVELFGMGENGITFFPLKGSVPNAFWRFMQYLILGNKWKRIVD